MRWTWVDRFVSFEAGKSAVAVKNLSHAEDHFADHFPGFPVMPASLILEGLAQTGGILVGHASHFQKNVVLAKMSSRVHAEVMPGEQLTYEAVILDANDTGARIRGAVRSGSRLVLEAEIMFAHVSPSQLPPGLADTRFVFSGELAHLLRMAESVATAGVVPTDKPAGPPAPSPT